MSHEGGFYARLNKFLHEVGLIKKVSVSSVKIHSGIAIIVDGDIGSALENSLYLNHFKRIYSLGHAWVLLINSCEICKIKLDT